MRSKKKTTKDELFILKLFEIAEKRGDPFTEVDRYEIGRLIGQNDKGIDVIVRIAAQTNFIKKADDNLVYLTPHGLSFVRMLQDQ